MIARNYDGNSSYGSDSNRTSTAPFKCFLELTYATITKLLQDEQAKQAWLKQVSERWPKVAEWLKEILYNSQTQPKWLSANYRDVVMTQFGQGRIG